MDIKWHKEAEKEFLQFPDRIQEKLKPYIEKLPEKGLNWDKVRLIEREDIGLEAYRIKVMPEEDRELNHRVIFDVEGQNYVIYKIGQRPEFYGKENLREVEERT
ncbi:MAG: type II toxin-antitoxin system RelE/ParE family toxin [Candidatus Nanosalina sp.]